MAGMATDPLVLYDNAFSPYAFKVRATLYEKGIEHRKHEMRVAADRDALLKVNPRGEVPAISHGDALVYDSSVICEYLESVFPEPPLFPRSPAEQARCRLLERMADGPIDGCVIGMAIVKLFAPQLEKSHPHVLAAALEQLGRLYEYLEQELGGREYFCGELSRADLALVAHLSGASVMGAPPTSERLAAWHLRMTGRPAIVRAQEEFTQAFRESLTLEDPFFGKGGLHVRDHRLEWCVRFGLAQWIADELEAKRVHFSPVP